MVTKRDSGICYFLMVLMMLAMVSTLRSSATSVQVAGNFQSSCNGTVGQCMSGGGSLADDEEYLMESEVSGRILAATNSLNALRRGPVCDAKIYANCIKQSNKANRPCTTYNRCQHST